MASGSSDFQSMFSVFAILSFCLFRPFRSLSRYCSAFRLAWITSPRLSRKTYLPCLSVCKETDLSALDFLPSRNTSATQRSSLYALGQGSENCLRFRRHVDFRVPKYGEPRCSHSSSRKRYSSSRKRDRSSRRYSHSRPTGQAHSPLPTSVACRFSHRSRQRGRSRLDSATSRWP